MMKYRSLRERIEAIPVGERYLNDMRFRTRVSLYAGMAVNLLFIVLEMGVGFYTRSVWFFSLAVYYALLAAMRYLLVRRRGVREGPETDLRRYRACGILLLVMNQTLMGIVLFMVRHGRGFRYPGYLVYAMALYAFYAVITASVRLGKTRKYESPALSAAMAIRLVTATVSILALETAMLDQFGQPGEERFRAVMVSATGGCVCFIIIAMALNMIAKSTASLRVLKGATEYGQDKREI